MPTRRRTRSRGRTSRPRGDVIGFPPTVINVNECDPLRDEGIAFYRLLRSPASARGRVRLGTFHGADLATALCPEISHETASDLATFAKE